MTFLIYIFQVAIIHIPKPILIRKIVGRIIDFVVYVEAVIGIGTFVPVIETIFIGIVSGEGMVRFPVKIKIVPFYIIGNIVVVAIIIKIVLVIRTICIFWFKTFVPRTFIGIVQTIVVIVGAFWGNVSVSGLRFHIIRDSVII